MALTSVRYCPDCGSSHLGPRCGMTFGERMRTVQLDTMSLPVRRESSDTYFDREAIADQFGDDAQDQVLEETKGLGAPMEDGRGGLWRRDRHSKEIVPVTQEDIDKVYLGGDDVEPDPAETEVA